jgi:hypothetical protein
MQHETCIMSIHACHHVGLLYIIHSLHSSMLNCHISLSTTTLQPVNVHAESVVLSARDPMPCSCVVDISVALSVQATPEFTCDA